MLDYGVDPNLANDDGLTALHQVSLTHRFSLRMYLMLLLYNRDSTECHILTTIFQTTPCLFSLTIKAIDICFTIKSNRVIIRNSISLEN